MKKLLQVLMDAKAGHASSLNAKVAELTRQLSEVRSASNNQQDRQVASIEELSAKLAAEKRRTAALKVTPVISVCMHPKYLVSPGHGQVPMVAGC